MSGTFNSIPNNYGPQTTANSPTVNLASDQAPVPVTGSFTANDPANGTPGSPVPTTAKLVAGKDPSGNLQDLPLTAAGAAVKTDGSATTQPVSAASLPLPSGAATSALQTTVNTSITNVGLQLPASLGQKTSANSLSTVLASDATLPLPTGAATSALQTTGNTSLSSITTNTSNSATSLSTIATNTPTVGQKAMAASSPVVLASDQSAIPVSQSGTWTTTLPSGAATSALQTTGNTSLATIATNTPAVGQTTSSGSSPVVIASDQSAVKTNLTNVGGSALALGQTTASGSIPVVLASNQTSIPTSAPTGRTALAPVYMSYSATNVTTSAYVQLVASTSAAVNRLYISDTSGSGFYIATGGSGSEVNQILYGPGGSDAPFELAIAAGTRISIKAADTNATVGAVYITLLS